MPINPRALSDNPLTGTTSHSMNHRESPPLAAGARRALRSLSLLLVPALAPATAPAMPRPRHAFGQGVGEHGGESLPYLAMAGAPPLRFEKSTPPPDLVARPAAAAPPLASRRLTETSVALAERCCRPLDRCDHARARVRSPRSQRSLRSPRRLYPNPRLAPFSRTTCVPRFDRKTFSRIFKSPDQPDRRMRST